MAKKKRLSVLEALKAHWKRYLASSAVTFASGFITTLAVMLDGVQGWGDLSLLAVVGGSAFVGFRLLVKLWVEILGNVGK